MLIESSFDVCIFIVIDIEVDIHVADAANYYF